NEHALGGNIVDLRGIAMRRLEERLDRLEETHRSVIAAAYENLAGTNIVHRAVLRLLEPADFPGFLDTLRGPVAEALRVDSLRLAIETAGDDPGAEDIDAILRAVPAGFVARYMGAGRPGAPLRAVVLRQAVPPDDAVHGDRAADIRSEALLRLDFGEGRLPGMLALGAEDPHQFRPGQGTDLLAFLGAVFERMMRRWLA
ncbi:MAG: DUF484 family protein, partial [Gemmobacter sp.]